MAADNYPEITWITPSGNWPSFSPEGDRIVFAKFVLEKKKWQLEIVSSSGEMIMQPDTGDLDASRPDWSWNQKTIAFTGQLEKEFQQLWLIDSSGANCRRVPLKGVDGHILYPSWYKNSNSLVVQNIFRSKLKTRTRLLQVDFDQKGEAAWTPLTDISEIAAGRPSTSPDAAEVVFAGKKGDFDYSHNQIWAVKPPHSFRQINSGQGRSPNWSPDGKWILFESARNYKRSWWRLGKDYKDAPFIISASGQTPPVQIGPTTFEGLHAEWSPDQAKIVLSGSPYSGIGLIDTPPQFLPETGKI